jgi:uncharacterized protein (DUF302 family)
MEQPFRPELQLPTPFDAALAKVREALKAEGFGVLTEIDMQAAFREKLGREFRPYLILGACNPPLAYAALNADPSVGLFLPCNVAVEAADGGSSIVRLADPHLLLASGGLAENATVRRVADDARQRLVRVAAALSADAAG